MKNYRFNRFITHVSVAFSLVGSTFAATYQWDPNGIAPGLAGTGTWSGDVWDLVGTGLDDGTDATVSSAGIGALDTIEFGAPAGIVTRSAGGLTAGTSNFVTGYTMNLSAGSVTYSFGALTGNPTLNFTLGASQNPSLGTTNLTGYTGVMNLGVSQAANAGRLQIPATSGQGLTSSATVNITANTTLYTSGNASHAAPVTLSGGDTAEGFGQLRLDNGSDWTGSVTLAGAMTSTDSIIGNAIVNASGGGFISGNIGEDIPGRILSVGASFNGNSKMTLKGSNTFTGGTVVTGPGTLALDYTVNNTSKVSSTAPITLNPGANLRFVGNAGANTSQVINGLTLNGAASIYLDTQPGFSVTADFSSGAYTNAGAGINVGTTGSGTAQLKLPGTVANTALQANVIFNNTFGATDASNFLTSASGTVNNTASDLATWATGNTQYVTTGSAFTGVVGNVTIDGITFSDAAARTVNIGSGSTLGLNRGIIVSPTVGNNLSTVTGGVIRAASSGGSLTVFNANPSNRLAIASVIGDNGGSSLVKSGAGVLTLSGLAIDNNTYAGGTTINGGTISLGTGGTIANTSTATALGAGDVTINPGGTLRLWIKNDTTHNIANNLVLNGGTVRCEDGVYNMGGTVSLTGASTFQTVYGTKNLNFTNTITGDGSLIIRGSGTSILAGPNDYSGGTTLNGGNVRVSNTSGLGSGSVVVIANSTIDAQQAFSNNISINTGITLGFGGGFANISGVVSGLGGINTSNNGVLRGDNTYEGGTTITGGFLCISKDSSLGLLPVSPDADNIIMSGGGSLSNFPITFGPIVTVDANRGITLNAGISGGIDAINGSTFVLNGVISGAGGLRTSSTATTGTIVLNGLNTYTGKTILGRNTTVISSIKNVGDVTGSSLGNPADAAAGTIDLGSGTVATTTLRYVGSGDSTSNRVINLAGTTGGATLDQSGTGLFKFTSALTATGLGSKTLTLTGSTAGIGEISGAIVDNSVTNVTSVTKTGTGTWLITGVNTYTGDTTVSGGTLGGTGSANSTLYVDFSGILSPGASVGTFLAKSAEFTDSTFAVEVDRFTTTADKLVVPGVVTLTNATLTVSEIGSGALPPATKFTIVDYTGGSLVGTFDGLAEGATIAVGSTVYTINYNDLSKITLTVTSGAVGGYDTWKTQITNGKTARTQDADDDGFTNLQEFLFGTNPMVGNGSLSTTERSGGNLIIRWKERETASEADYQLKESATLANPWANSPAPVTNDGAAASGYQPRRADVTIGAGKLFFRVEGVETN